MKKLEGVFMELLIIWIGTIITSFCMEISNSMRLYKDMADLGYKINNEKLREVNSQTNPAIRQQSFFSLLIPIYNIFCVFERAIKYNNLKNMVFDQLNILGILEEMNEQEILEYSKKKTGFNAIMVAVKNEINLKNSYSLKEDESEIRYQFNDNKIVILKVSGPASKLSLEEQKQLVIDSWKNLMEVAKEEFGSIEKFCEELEKNKGSIILNSNDDLKQDKELNNITNINEKIQQLKNLRDEVESSEDIEKNKNEEKGQKLSKK